MTKAIKLNDIIKYRCVLYSEHCEVYNLVCTSQYIASQFWIHNKPPWYKLQTTQNSAER